MSMKNIFKDLCLSRVGNFSFPLFSSKNAMEGLKGSACCWWHSTGEKESISMVAQRPARESEMPWCSSKRFEPDKMYISCRSCPYLSQMSRCESMVFLSSSSRIGAFCISSMIRAMDGFPEKAGDCFGPKPCLPHHPR